MAIEDEINALAAETLAIQVLLAHVLDRVASADLRIAAAIRAGFDDAANDIEDTVIKLGKAASPDHAVKALAIVEYLRAATFADKDRPKDIV
jgi:hypothetical protein